MQYGETSLEEQIRNAAESRLRAAGIYDPTADHLGSRAVHQRSTLAPLKLGVSIFHSTRSIWQYSRSLCLIIRYAIPD